MRGVNFLWKNEGTGGGHLPDESRILRTRSANWRRTEFEKCQLIKGAITNMLGNNFKDNSIEIYAPKRPKSAVWSTIERTEDQVENDLFNEVEEIDYGD